MTRSLRVLVGAAGLAGHTLPALALAGRLAERGHAVSFCGYRRWAATATRIGLEFTGGESELADGVEPGDHVAVARALAAGVERFGADVVVGDALSLTPGLAAELAGVPRAILLPEVFPVSAPGLPLFSLGLRAPRTAAGAAFWRAAGPLLEPRLPTTAWLRWSRGELDRLRDGLGLGPEPGLDAPVAGRAVLVATLPELEYPREWPAGVTVIGPLFAAGDAPAVELPAGNDPLVVVAPSTVKDPEGRLIAAALDGLADEPVRVLVSTGGGAMPAAEVPANAVVADWIDFALLGRAALVVCHGNHGTVARALTEGTPVLVSPALADDAEHGARVAWSGAGAMVPRRLLGPRSLREAARMLLAEPRYAVAAAAIRDRSAGRDAATAGAEAVEGLALAGAG